MTVYACMHACISWIIIVDLNALKSWMTIAGLEWILYMHLEWMYCNLNENITFEFWNKRPTILVCIKNLNENCTSWMNTVCILKSSEIMHQNLESWMNNLECSWMKIAHLEWMYCDLNENVTFEFWNKRPTISAWWSSTYKWYSHLHGEVLHTNDTLAFA